MVALDNKLGAGHASRRALHHAAGDLADSRRRSFLGRRMSAEEASIDARELLELMQVNSSELLHYCHGLWSFECQRTPALGLVGERDVVHDDVFVHPLDELLANHGVRDAKVLVCKRVGFQFGEDVTLRIEEQGNGPLSWGEILDVVRQNRIEVAHAVRPSEGKVRTVVFVEKRDALIREPVFGCRIAKITWQS